MTLAAPWGAGLDYSSQRFDEKRDGVAAILTFKPSKSFTSQFDLFYTKFSLYTKKQFVKGGLGSPITDATSVIE